MDKIRALKLSSEIKGKSVGGWDILEFINYGASAAVFRATKNNTIAALKIIDPEFEEKYGAVNQEGRIDLEKRLIGKEHPNLVKIFDGGRCPDSNYLYIVMEFLPGKNLNDYLGKVPKNKIESIISQVASAAKFLEDIELCHRDIKPANIHITDNFEKAILMDLGILRHISGGGHGTEDQFIGSTKYSPPEFIYREEEKTIEGWRAVTFYQLGAVLYDLLMGKNIFNEINNYAKVIEAVKNKHPVIECLECPQTLVTVARCCLNKIAINRLKLVKWEDLLKQENVTPAPSIELIKEEIKKRQAGISTQNTQSTVSRITIKRLLDTIIREFQDLVRQKCQHSDLFPAVRIVNSNGNEVSIKNVLVSVEPSPHHSIYNNLYIEFCINLIDATQTLISLNYRASLGRSITSNNESWVEIYRGPYSKENIEKNLDEILHRSLYSATDKIQEIEDIFIIT